MKEKRIVVALGRNAFGETFPEQKKNVKKAAQAIADLVEQKYQIVITHSNGPQVGMIQTAMTEFARLDNDKNYTVAPMSLCGAMSEGYIGYDLQNAIRTELLDRGIFKPVSTIITQVRVDENDPAFQAPSKPIGHFMTAEQAKEAEEKYGYIMKEDSGRGYRRVVASPKPAQIIEIGAIRSLVDSGQLVIACGGGGIPVTLKGNHLKGASAVIDKDFASELLAEELDADFLIILTAVEKAAINYGKPDVKWLSDITTDEARQYIEEGHFAPGSMLPKVQAAVKFADSKEGRTSLITLLEKAKEEWKKTTGGKYVCPVTDDVQPAL